MTRRSRADMESDLTAEINFYKEMCQLLMESNEVGFISMQEAAEILGLNEVTIYTHTKGIAKCYNMVPIPWVRWYQHRLKNKFNQTKKPEVKYKKKRRQYNRSSKVTT